MAVPFCSCSLSKMDSSDTSSSSESSEENETSDTTEEDEEEETTEEPETTTSSADDEVKEEDENSGERPDFVIEKDSADLEQVREHARQLIDDLKVSENEENIQKDIDLLLDDMDIVYETSSKLMIPYYLDWNNEKLEAEYDDSFENVYITNSLITYAFIKGKQSEEYSYMFDDLILDNVDLEAFDAPSLTLKKLEGYTRVEYTLMDEQLDEYHDIAYDEDMDEDEKAERCAEIYLDLLSQYDAETFYDEYFRDYTGDEILELSKTIREEILPVSDDLLNAFFKCDGATDVIYKPKEFDDPFEVIKEYAPKLSKEIGDAADVLVKNKLYTIASGDDCYDGSFTDNLPVSDSAHIYIYDDEDYNALLTPVHEFGHYYATFYDDIPTYLSTSNLDIAETQSQGFEFLFMQFYDDIYGDQAEAMKVVKTYDMLYAVITGFFVGEFEYKVLKNKDTYTPEDVINCWDEIMGDYLPGVGFYEINHIFETPGYYISYGVSALAAFDIWEDCLYDPDAALEKYERVVRISCNDSDYQFRSAMKKAGFSEVLNKKYIKTLADELSDYASEIGE